MEGEISWSKDNVLCAYLTQTQLNLISSNKTNKQTIIELSKQFLVVIALKE